MATLKNGSRGNDVKRLQEVMNKAAGKKVVKVDGKFGPKTEKALKELQKKSKLKVTGVADKKMILALSGAGAGKKGGAKVPGWTIKVGSKTEEMKKADYEAGKKTILKNLKRGILLAIKNRSSECRIMYDHFVEMKKEQSVVTWLVEATSGADLPPKSLITNAENAAAAVESAIKAGDMARIKKALEKCEKPLNAAVNAMRVYKKKVIGGGENWVTGLQITRDVSFTIVSTWATAGAGSVAGAAYAAGSVALLKESAGAVGKITANPAKALTLNDARNMALEVGVAAMGGAFTKGEIGKKIISGAGSIFSKSAGSMGLKTISKVSSGTLNGWMSRVMQGIGSNVVEEAAKQGVLQLKSNAKPEDFYKNIATKAIAAALFGPFEEALKSDKLAPKVAALVQKAGGDKFFVVLDGATKVELVPRKQRELVIKFMSGAGSDVVGKLLLEPVVKKATGKESPQVFSDNVAKEFVKNAKAMKALHRFIEKHHASNKKDFQPAT